MPDSLCLALYEKIRYRRGPIYRARLDERSNVEFLLPVLFAHVQKLSLHDGRERIQTTRGGPFMSARETYIHSSAEVSPEAVVGDGTLIWRQAHVREGAHIVEMCNIGKGVYVDTHVHVGSCVKIQNHASLFEG